MPELTSEIGRETAARAVEARAKPSPYGPDLELDAYHVAAGAPRTVEAAVSPDDQSRLLGVGVDLAEKSSRAGSFLQVNHTLLHCLSGQEDLEVLGIAEARSRYPWLENYWWRAVQPDADKYTAQVALAGHGGYFVRALPGARATFPLQAGLFLAEEGLAQAVHNVVVVEEGAELNLVTGCASALAVRRGLHVGVSELYVKRGARLTFTMIHRWAEEVAVRPRTGVVVEEDATFLSNYIALGPVRSIQMYPTAWLRGPRALARFSTVVVAHPGAELDLGSRAILEAPGARAELVARTISLGGRVVSRGQLVGKVPGVRGHLECRGLILAPGGSILAVPELEGDAPDLELSHEAAVGRINPEEVEYLMARGLDEEQATAVIVRGFLNVGIEGLPPALEREMRAVLDLGASRLL
jgi:uncharacterized protein